MQRFGKNSTDAAIRRCVCIFAALCILFCAVNEARSLKSADLTKLADDGFLISISFED